MVKFSFKKQKRQQQKTNQPTPKHPKTTGISEHQGLVQDMILSSFSSLYFFGYVYLFYIHYFTYSSALLWILNVLNTIDLYYVGFKATDLCNDLMTDLHYPGKNRCECSTILLCLLSVFD